MCGRTACTLDPDDICRACSYKEKRRSKKWTVPEWKDCPSGRTYHPSHNVAPTSHTPVLIAEREDEDPDNKDHGILRRTVQPMYWTLVPSWHKGELKELSLSTNNARFETIAKKPLFNVPLKNGHRCVVLSDGYYEWRVGTKTNKVGSKQPYFIYFPQPNGIKPGDLSSWKDNLGAEVRTSKDGWQGPRLLTMAGVYDIWTEPEGGNQMYSYAIVTMDASNAVSFIHERMPAILDGDDAVRDWLDYKNVPLEEALKLIVPVDKLAYHPVDKAVGNSRNKSPSCVAAIDLEGETKAGSKSRSLMEKWLKTPPNKKRTSPSSNEGTSRKKFQK